MTSSHSELSWIHQKVDAASSAIRELTIAGKFCSGTKPCCNKATALQNSPSDHGGGTQILSLCEAQKKIRKHFGHQSCNMCTPWSSLQLLGLLYLLHGIAPQGLKMGFWRVLVNQDSASVNWNQQQKFRKAVVKWYRWVILCGCPWAKIFNFHTKETYWCKLVREGTERTWQ